VRYEFTGYVTGSSEDATRTLLVNNTHQFVKSSSGDLAATDTDEHEWSSRRGRPVREVTVDFPRDDERCIDVSSFVSPSKVWVPDDRSAGRSSLSRTSSGLHPG
jgi:hypothetical protein